MCKRKVPMAFARHGAKFMVSFAYCDLGRCGSPSRLWRHVPPMPPPFLRLCEYCGNDLRLSLNITLFMY